MAKIWENDTDEYTSDYLTSTSAGDSLETAMQQATNKGFGPVLENTVGLCATCKFYSYVINDMHQVVVSHCRHFGIVNMRTKVQSCNKYYREGQLSLVEMYEIATLIDVEKGGKTIGGFTGTNKKNKQHGQAGFTTKKAKQKEGEQHVSKSTFSTEESKR